MAAAGIITGIHEDTIRLTRPELVRQLISHLGPTLVATLADVKDRKLPHRWAKADGSAPRPASLERLQMAHRIWKLISTTESDMTARAWFIGANPRLGEQSPIMAIREGRLAETHDAAVAFTDGTDD